MAATLVDEPRRAAPGGPAGREFPVLFHLMDVSRPRVVVPLPESDPAPLPVAKECDASVESSVAEAPTASQIAIELSQPTAAASLAPPLADPAPMPTLAPSLTNETPPASGEEPPRFALASPSSESAAAETPTPAADKAPVARPAERRPAQATLRRRSDWFTNQGKYIAIGFVLALVATIYLARSNRGGGPTTAIQPTVHPGDAGKQVAASESKPATVVGTTKRKSNKAKPSVEKSESSPARLAESTPGEKPPTAELHPPTIPQVVQEPAHSSQPDNSALFPWSGQPGDRLATRPAEPQAAVPSQAVQPMYPVTPANAPLSQSYPVTEAASPNFIPAPQAPAPAQPDYRSPYIPAPPAGQPPASGQGFVPSGGAASPSMPPENTASGYRYERTGSGPY